MSYLDEDCFGDLTNRQTFLVIKKMLNEGKNIFFSDVCIEAGFDLGQSIQIKYSDHIGQKDLYKPEFLNTLIKYKKLREKHRELLNTLHTLKSEEIMGIDTKLEYLERGATKLLQIESSTSGYEFLTDKYDEAFNKADNEKVSTGIEEIDEITQGGFCKGTLAVVAASPSTGKTVMGAHILTSMIKANPDKKGLFFSCELRISDMIRKFFMAYAQKHHRSFDEKTKKDYFDMFKDRIATVDNKNVDISFIEREIRRFCSNNDCQTVVIDYLGLLENSEFKREAEYLKIKNITSRLSRLSAELNINIILLSQINRDFSKRSDPRPLMTDSADSTGAYDSAAYWFGLFRDEDHCAPNTIEIWLRKNRYGANNTMCTLMFDEGIISSPTAIQHCKIQEHNNKTKSENHFDLSKYKRK
jgi:replicative DNA helicase